MRKISHLNLVFGGQAAQDSQKNSLLKSIGSNGLIVTGSVALGATLGCGIPYLMLTGLMELFNDIAGPPDTASENPSNKCNV